MHYHYIQDAFLTGSNQEQVPSLCWLPHSTIAINSSCYATPCIAKSLWSKHQCVLVNHKWCHQWLALSQADDTLNVPTARQYFPIKSRYILSQHTNGHFYGITTTSYGNSAVWQPTKAWDLLPVAACQEGILYVMIVHQCLCNSSFKNHGLLSIHNNNAIKIKSTGALLLQHLKHT